MTFILTDKQRIATQMLNSDAIHTLLYGGSRSGKSFLAVKTIIYRALWSAGSRHLMARFRLSHIKSSIVADTWPKVMRECYPDVAVTHHKTEGYYEFDSGGSQVWYGGLDEKERTEKILGMEFASLLLEEASQIPWASAQLLITRLAMKTGEIDGHVLRPKAIYCENPPLKSHWTYKQFIQKVSPDTQKPLLRPLDYISLLMNPKDNTANISSGYMDILNTLSERQRKRFRDGQFGEAGEAALWTYELIEQQRLEEFPDVNDIIKVIAAVDPSGADNADDATHDAIGIIILGMTTKGKCVVLEDDTFLGSPKEWGELVIQRLKAWGGDTVVAEMNFGGAMVKFVIQSAAANLHTTVKFVPVIASRGKTVRAEPVSALYETQMVEHAPGLDMLEDELVQMSTYGYTGDRSPNRADALVWGVSYLFPQVIKASKDGASAGMFLAPPRVVRGYAGLKARH